MKGLFLTVLISAVIVTAGRVLAQETPDAPLNGGTTPAAALSADGVVVSVSPSMLVVRTETGEEMSFDIDDTTVLATATALMPGSRVTVDYHILGANEYHAAEVTSSVELGSPGGTETPGSATPSDASRSMASDPSTTTSGRLPDTAGTWPAVLGLGFLALASALVVRRATRAKGHRTR